jgi:glycosyltransferase involved in cell wall biosynthesis
MVLFGGTTFRESQSHINMKLSIKNLVSRRMSRSIPIKLKGTGAFKGNVLLSYGTEIYKRIQQGKGFVDWHSTSWENYHLSKAFLDRGYDVDVIDYLNPNFTPKKDYAVFIDVMTNLGALSKRVNSDCIKIFFPAFSHWIFNNAEEYARLAQIRDRRSAGLIPRALISPGYSLETANFVLQRGNGYNQESFAFAKKTMLPISSSSTLNMEWDSRKNFAKARNNFLWLGSRGAAHKGLDLVLEAFRDLPEFRLAICGSVEKEKDFCSAYFDELYNTPNIEVKGWIDTSSSEFAEIANASIALIFPSCSELSAGTAITCMHAGLIPIISEPVGVDTEDFGYILKESSIEEIKSTIVTVATKSESELEETSRATWEFARKRYTKEAYLSSLESAIDTILGSA